MDRPEGIEPAPVGEVAEGVADRVLEDVVNLPHEDLDGARLLDGYQSSRLPASTRAKPIGMKSIPMKRVIIQSEERPRAMGL